MIRGMSREALLLATEEGEEVFFERGVDWRVRESSDILTCFSEVRGTGEVGIGAEE